MLLLALSAVRVRLPCKAWAVFSQISDVDALILLTTGNDGPHSATDKYAKARQNRK